MREGLRNMAVEKHNKNLDWEREAKKHAAEAGELKIAIAEKLEEVRERIRTVTKEVERESDVTVAVAVRVGLSELKRQERWLEKILYGGTGWREAMMKRFMEKR